MLLLPRDLDAPTGGCRYDRRVLEALHQQRWACEVMRLDDSFPRPDAAALANAESAVSALPDGSTVIADGLAFGAMPDIAARHAARLRWVALVHHPLGLETGLDAAESERLIDAERRALAAARRIVVTSEATAAALARLHMVGRGAQPAVVIEPGCDLPRARGARSAGDGSRRGQPAASAAPQILCVASVTPRKGHLVLLDALAGLQNRPWVLHNVGSLTMDAAAARDAQAAALRHGLAARVLWHGAAEAEALDGWYRRADLFVLPSYFEGYGMVVAEALAHGLPIVASDTGHAARLLAGGAGLLVAPGDAKALRTALARLLDSAPDRAALSAAAACAAPERLPSWNEAGARWQTLLQAVASESP